jgi:hypothetical protein
MAPLKKTIRGVQNIRTLAGMADDKALPHKVFLRIACLEMERARRGQERRAAMARVRDIDDRFREIDAEKRERLAAMAGAKPATRASQAPADAPLVPSPRGGNGFKFKY